jgi:hypothetical protein
MVHDHKTALPHDLILIFAIFIGYNFLNRVWNADRDAAHAA